MTSPKTGRSASNRIFQFLIEKSPYIAAGVLVFGVVLYAIWPLGIHTLNITSEGGDMLGVQAQFQVAGNAGPVGVDSHLSWPIGYSDWEAPQLGLLILTFGFVFIRMLGVASLAAYDLTFATIAGLSAIAVVFFLRSVINKRLRIFSVAIAVAIAAGPFVLLKQPHVNIAAFFLIPLLFGVLLRSQQAQSRGTRWWLFAVLLFVAAISPSWWIILSLVLLIAIAPAYLSVRKQPSFSALGYSFVAVLAGFLVPAILAFAYKVPGSAPTRSAWDSNIYGGHLIDLLLASPFLNTLWPALNNLKAGSSPELSFVGLIGGLLAIAAVTASIATTTAILKGLVPRLLAAFTVTSLLIFVMGGIGNLQAGMFVLFGGESPARVWARAIILLTVVGAGWAMMLIDKIMPAPEVKAGWVRRSLYVAIVMIICTATVADVQASLPLSKPKNASEFAEYQSVKFLEKNLKPCPVAQLPADSTPMSQVLTWETFNKFNQRGYVAFLMAPQFEWSFGRDNRADLKSPISELPNNLSAGDFAKLRGLGYCAILFDKDLSIHAQNMHVPLPGTTVPSNIKPSRTGKRFDVYLLNQSK